MTTSPSPIAPSPCSSNGASGSSLPRWRSFLSMLNWRRDPDHERKLADIEMKIIDEDLRIADIEMRIIEEDQRAAASEMRTRQIESDIVRLRSESEQIKKETEQIRQDSERIKKETVLIENEILQIEQETELLRRQNAKGRELLASMHALCYPDASSSTPAPSIATDSVPSLP